MYYAPWCGFCKSVKHVIMSLVDHYKYSEHIRIARLVDVFCMLDLPRGFVSELG